MLDDNTIQALKEKGYRIAQNGERAQYLYRYLLAGGLEARNEEVAKCKQIAEALGLGTGYEIVPLNFI